MQCYGMRRRNNSPDGGDVKMEGMEIGGVVEAETATISRESGLFYWAFLRMIYMYVLHLWLLSDNGEKCFQLLRMRFRALRSI